MNGICKGCDIYASLFKSPLSNEMVCTDCQDSIRGNILKLRTIVENRVVHPHEISDPDTRSNTKRYKFMPEGRSIRHYHVDDMCRGVMNASIGTDINVITVTVDDYICDGQHRMVMILKLNKPMELSFKILPWSWDHVDERPAIRKAVRDLNRVAPANANETLKMTTPSLAMAKLIARYPQVGFKASGRLMWSKILRAFAKLSNITDTDRISGDYALDKPTGGALV